MEITFSLNEIKAVASKLIAHFSEKTILFYGEMGVGKTTLIKELAKQLGVVETLSSPTFSIVNEYQAKIICYTILIVTDSPVSRKHSILGLKSI